MKTVVQEALPEIERVGGEEFENEKNTVCCIDIERTANVTLKELLM